ncbi:MAG: HD domain-containing protein [Anaerolineae bacterium]|nr:HD domain-containing protein [Anaerolineae bacterium]
MAEPKNRQLSPRFEEALVFATRLHAGQVRKVGGAPYISHLMAVAALVLQDGGGEDEAIAALLHDAVEDQGGLKTLEEIRGRFGEAVAEIVAACSDTHETPKPPWKARKQAHIADVRQGSAGAQRVMLADKLHNARALLRELRREGEAVWAHFNGGREGTLWYYANLHAALAESRQGYLMDELGRVIAEIEQLAGAG